MNNRWKIILGVLIVSGLVFAAVETKFYGNINLQGNKVVSMGTPTSSTDGVNKAYADSVLTKANTNLYAEKVVLNTAINGRLSVSGGAMNGGIDMNGYKITSVGTPYFASDVATKEYVDTIASQSSSASGYQYFGLKKGGYFTPLYNLDSNTNYWLTFTVLKEFYGYPVLWTEGVDAIISNFNTTARAYKVGETFKAELYIADDASYRTNGSVIVRGGEGVIGNFGITFPPTATPQFKVYIGSELYGQNTAASIAGEFDGSGNIKIGITNLTAIAGSIGIKCPKAKMYVNDGERPTTITASGTPYTAPTIVATYILGKKCEWITVNFGLDPETGGVRWDFDALVSPSVTNHFGQFYLYSN